MTNSNPNPDLPVSKPIPIPSYRPSQVFRRERRKAEEAERDEAKARNERRGRPGRPS
ncbi:hypothetical protein LQ938_13030 [Microbacterium sp. cx-55]|uniref:hypothetical protein n=1 Tax=Microbacterium sp. cx-55 TaxID=2875948 RepID=UPI001E37945D|nr:hypothetical protein [Microbacterium sp. cx-55]UGB34777.1 hypothetical protein LQ938_13030 [Microbacterium sp. cx-55]